MKLEAYGQTNVGLVREHNEDKALVRRRLFVVADGLGGHQAGEVASDMLINALDHLDDEQFDSVEAAQSALLRAIETANSEIHTRAAEEPGREGMGTTVTAALVHERTMVFGQVGDTRAYLKRGDEPMRLVTPDHSFVGALVDAGYITRDEARSHPQRSVILKAVGQKDTLEADPGEVLQLQPGDEIILASDGVTGVVEDEELDRLVHGQPLPQAIQTVVDAALAAGGPDNITIVVVRVVADDVSG